MNVERDRRVQRSLPIGLLGTIVLIAAIEETEFRANPMFLNTHSLSWRFVNKKIDQMVKGREVLCFGDSLVKYGVLPRVLKKRAGMSGYNLALFGGPAPASYFLLERALKQGARPSAVVVDFVSGLLSEGPASTRRAYPWVDLLTLRETIDLAWTSRDPDLFMGIWLARQIPSLRGRHEVRARVLQALRGEESARMIEIAMLQRNWNQNEGAHAVPKRDAPPSVTLDGAPLPGNWRCEPANEVYLRRFLALAERHGIAVFWLAPPVSPTEQAVQDHYGEDACFTAFVQKTITGFRGVTFVDARRSGYESELFIDRVHLDREGATALSVALADIVTQRQTSVTGSDRLVKLQRCEPIDVFVEDIDSSRIALRGIMRGRTR
jgi:hypothetical protein